MHFPETEPASAEFASDPKRKDLFGNPIVHRKEGGLKGNRSKQKLPQRIMFKDQVTTDPSGKVDPEKQVLATVYYVESLKNINRSEQINDEGCCTIF